LLETIIFLLFYVSSDIEQLKCDTVIEFDNIMQLQIQLQIMLSMLCVFLHNVGVL